MPATRSIASSILLAVSLASVVSSAPTVTEGLARRSTVSNGVVCSYQCPTINDYTFIGGLAYDGHYWECVYQGPNGDSYCGYDVQTGEGDEPVNSNPDCPANAAGPFCGTNPDSNQYFKRALPAPRKRSAAEQAIAKRQYKPKRNAMRANEGTEEREV